jgi:SAM-dependent methyltransferase
MVDDSRSYGTGVAYWDRRHAEDAADGRSFDWLFEYNQMKTLLKRYISRDAAVLQLGCGNSRLALEWSLDGHRGVMRNVDFAPRLVAQMNAEALELFPSCVNVTYEVADVRWLDEHEFPAGSFDAVVDKGTFDCIACNTAGDYQADLESMLRGAFRVLKPGGTYLLLSCGDPESRLPWLDDEPGLEWAVSVALMAIRSQQDTNQNHRALRRTPAVAGADAGADEPRPSDQAADVFVSDEVLVSESDSWHKELGILVEDQHTFVYICRKTCTVQGHAE